MNSIEKLQAVGFLRLTASIFYDALFVAAILFFATLPLALLPDEIRSLQLTEILKVIWYLLVSYFYFAMFWLKGGQTAGMKPWRIKLVDMEGDKPGLKLVTLRFFAAILSWALAGLGFLWMLVDRNHRSLHDHLSSSKLVLVDQD